MKVRLLILPAICWPFAVVGPAFAQTWTQTGASNGYWYSIACSADGSKLVAGTYGQIYASTNRGQTWATNHSPSAYLWTSVASSADGFKLIAAAGFPMTGPVYTSTDSGQTWISNNLPSKMWFFVISSADGSKLAAGAQGYLTNKGAIYVSTNSGADWQISGSNDWYSAAASASGDFLVGISGNQISISTNWGLMWAVTSAPRTNWLKIACSVDGRTIVAAVSGAAQNPVYVSTNFGITWTKALDSFGSWSSAASSADGSRLLVTDDNQIFASTNNGSTWVVASPNKQWFALASSADGDEWLATTIPNGRILTCQTTPSPQLNLTLSGSNLTASWIIPSTNFVLQQSADLSNWTDLTNSPVLNLTNLQEEVVLSPTNSSGFYRLRTP